MERREARLRGIREKLAMAGQNQQEVVSKSLNKHHHIGVSQKRHEHIGIFLETNAGDPAIQVQWDLKRNNTLQC